MQRPANQQTDQLSRSIAVIGLFSAIYILGGGVLGAIVGPFVRGYPAHFMRGWLMSASAAYTGRAWSASLMGLIAGLAMLVIVPAPAPYIPVATLAAGLAYDAAVNLGGKYAENSRRPRRIILATSISSVVEAVIVLAILTYLGLFTSNIQVVAFIWVAATLANIALACLGALVTLWSIKRRLL